MKYVLGVDSGGTKYLIKACAIDHTLLGSHIGKPAYHSRIGVEEAYHRIKTSVQACLEGFGGKPEDCLAITVGAAGMDLPGDEKNIEDIYRRLDGFHCPIQVVNDAELVHYAVTGGVGVAVIAGTGSIAFGRDLRGKTARVGGWPPIIGGDEGSGTWIAYQALGHFSRVLDLMEAPGPLYAMLQSSLEMENGQDLMCVCEQIAHNTFHDPGISKLVNEAADLGDETALDILARAGTAVAQLANAVIRILDFSSQSKLIVGVWGSAIVKSTRHLNAFTKAVLAQNPHAEVRIAQGDAADAAIKMALNLVRG